MDNLTQRESFDNSKLSVTKPGDRSVHVVHGRKVVPPIDAHIKSSRKLLQNGSNFETFGEAVDHEGTAALLSK